MLDEVIRWIMFGAFLIAVPTYGLMIGVAIRGRAWPWRIMLAGGFVLLIYLTIGQIKARVYDVEVDWVSGIGLLGVCVLLVGMAAVLTKERRIHGQA